MIDGAETIALGGALRHRLATVDLWRTALSVLRQEHQRRPFDLLHAFWATESGLLAAVAGRLLGVPTLVSLAGGELVALRDIDYGDQRIAWERLKVAASLRLATAVSAGSQQLAGMAEAHLSQRNQHPQSDPMRSAAAQPSGPGMRDEAHPAGHANTECFHVPDPNARRDVREVRPRGGPHTGTASSLTRASYPTGSSMRLGRGNDDSSASRDRHLPMRGRQSRAGQPRLHVAPLGVDLDLFSPASTARTCKTRSIPRVSWHPPHVHGLPAHVSCTSAP